MAKARAKETAKGMVRVMTKMMGKVMMVTTSKTISHQAPTMTIVNKEKMIMMMMMMIRMMTLRAHLLMRM